MSPSDLAKVKVSLNDLINRIRILEQLTEKMDILISSLEREMNERERKLVNRITDIEGRIDDINSRLKKIDVDVSKIKNELEKKASKNEVKELNSLFELFNPVRSAFVTKEQVKMIVEELLEKKKKVETNI